MLNNNGFRISTILDQQQEESSGPDLNSIRPGPGSQNPYLINALNNALFEASKIGSLPEVTNENAKQLLDLASIDPTEELLAPPVCLEIVQGSKNSTIGTLGNFSMIIGKAKSRKTFFITIGLAAAVKRDFVVSRFKGSFPDNQSMVLFFDTEQGKYHVQKAVKRVLHLSGEPHPNNFKAYGLRKFKPSDRLKLIERAIYDTPDLGMVVIDGIRDLVSSINDEEQATMMASKLLKWSEERNIHIICVLHQNKGDNNARGHLGSELQNKAESVLAVTKSTDNSDISIVTPEFCREKEFEPFAFGIDENGLPYLDDYWTPKPSGEAKKKTSNPGDITTDKHIEILRKAFRNNDRLMYKELILQVKFSLNDFGINVGDSKVKEFIQWYKNEQLILQKGKEGSKASYYQFNEQV